MAVPHFRTEVINKWEPEERRLALSQQLDGRYENAGGAGQGGGLPWPSWLGGGSDPAPLPSRPTAPTPTPSPQAPQAQPPTKGGSPYGWKQGMDDANALSDLLGPSPGESTTQPVGTRSRYTTPGSPGSLSATYGGGATTTPKPPPTNGAPVTNMGLGTAATGADGTGGTIATGTGTTTKPPISPATGAGGVGRARSGAAPGGFSQANWDDPNMQSVKYAAGAFFNGVTRPSEVAAIVNSPEFQARFPGASFNGKDMVNFNGALSDGDSGVPVGMVDVLRSADQGADSSEGFWWGANEAGGDFVPSDGAVGGGGGVPTLGQGGGATTMPISIPGTGGDEQSYIDQLMEEIDALSQGGYSGLDQQALLQQLQA